MQIEFPLALEVVADAQEMVQAVRRILHRHTRIALITGKTHSRYYAEKLGASLQDKALTVVHIQNSTVDEVYSTERTVRRDNIEYIVAIGGGKVADFAKRLSYISNTPLMSIPTIIANDGMISPVAVLDDENQSISIPGKIPDSVIVDLSEIKGAPEKYLLSAACDIVTNLSATNDWKRFDALTNSSHYLAYYMSRMAAHNVIDCNCNVINIRSDQFMRSIIFGQVLSGVAMALAGSSRPCSGSEHLISHALDALKVGIDTLHGQKVGIASRFSLFLQGAHTKEISDFFQKFNVGKVLPGCEKMSHQEMQKVFSRARTMRPGRKTILDDYSDRDLASRYFDFVETKEH